MSNSQDQEIFLVTGEKILWLNENVKDQDEILKLL